MTGKHYALGIDIGGTFTDVVLYDDQAGQVYSHKELTTPDEPTQGAIQGLLTLLSREAISPVQISKVVHATTLFTNALIERRGAVTGLITTAGFADTLEMRREYKYELYDLFIELPRPLVPRTLRAEVEERMSANGAVEVPLNREALIQQARNLVDQGIESLAVVFLHAYANPQHEREALELMSHHFPDLYVSISSDVSPQIREFERTSTTAANAYIQPLANRYLSLLETRLRELGVTSPLLMMLSNGGLSHLGEARRAPIQLLESGPAAGAIAAAYFSKRSKVADVLALDMGGTTAKLSIVEDNEPLIAYAFEAGREKRFAPGSGLPLNISTVELIEIGAGGGSIARVDSLNLLKVGPLSAGAMPGPACYMRGGSAPTVTDANLLTGSLDADTFAGGTMKLNPDAAAASLAPITRSLAMAQEQVASGVLAIVNENMSAAARVHIAERGYEASNFALLVTGGGGPLHGCDVARRLGIRRVVCPPGAGVASALGLLIAPARIDRSITLARQLKDIRVEELEDAFRALEEQAATVMKETLGDGAAFFFERYADIRFLGQGFDLVTRLPDGAFIESTPATIQADFETVYRKVFGQIPPVQEIELINLRVSAREAVREYELSLESSANEQWQIGAQSRKVWQDESTQYLELPVLAREAMTVNQALSGPLIVEDASSTLLVPAGATVVRDEAGNLLIDLPEE